MAEMEYHEYCLLFPEMSDDDFKHLEDDLQRNGLREKIVTLDGKILDGRNRYRACVELGITPIFAPFNGKDALSYVISKNLSRRHLTASQRAAIAAEMTALGTPKAQENQKSALKKGDKSPVAVITPTGIDAAKQMHVHRDSVTRAAAIKKADPKKFEEVKSGKKTLNKAVHEINAPKAAPEDEPELNEDDAKLAKAFAAHKPVRDLRAQLQSVQEQFVSIPEEIRAFCSQQSIESHIESAKYELLASAPHAVCPYCDGDGCKTCFSSGIVTKTIFDNAPRELKADKAVRK